MRLFVAIDLPQQVIANLERLIAHLRPTARIRWSLPANLHLTTKFIGEWPQARLEELKAALRGLTERQPLPIDVRELGFFPNARSPRVFWAGVQAPPALAELARDTDRTLSRLGLPPENRPFSPHLTLARIKEPVPLNGLQQAIANLASVEFGAFTADRFYLYQSTLTPSGSLYTQLSEFLFTSL
jgi:2'-5' RNA ligase